MQSLERSTGGTHHTSGGDFKIVDSVIRDLLPVDDDPVVTLNERTHEWPARRFIPGGMRVYITVEACDLDSESGGAQQYVRGAGGAIAVRQTPEHEHVGASREAGDPGVNVYLRAAKFTAFNIESPRSSSTLMGDEHWITVTRTS